MLVRTEVGRPHEEVFDYLDEFANHAAFTDHFLVDWKLSGPRRGVGAKATARISAPGGQDWTDFELIESARPDRIVEDGVGAKEKRHTRGTYRLSDRSGGGTEVEFELEWLEAPRSERLLPPLSRLFLKRTNAKSLRRLKKRLEK